jgi:hypothetical protein
MANPPTLLNFETNLTNLKALASGLGWRANDRVSLPLRFCHLPTPAAGSSQSRPEVQAQPSSFMARPECQIFVMCPILSPLNCMT